MIANVINNNSKLIESRDKNNEKKKKANKKQKKYKKNKVAMNPEKNIKNEEISISKKNSNDIGSDSNESFPKYDQEPLKRSHEKIKEEIILDIKKSLSCDESKLFPINPNDIPNDFIEVKKKKSNPSNVSKTFKCPLRYSKQEKPQSKFNNDGKKQQLTRERTNVKEKNGLDFNKISKTKKNSIEEKVFNSPSKTLNQTSKNIPNTNSANKGKNHFLTELAINDTSLTNIETHHLDSELEKELKNPPNIHLSKNNKSKKETHSAKTLSTKGGDTCETNETLSPSQKKSYSSSHNYCSDEPFFDINLINTDEFKYDNLEEDTVFNEKVNSDLTEFLNEIQEPSPHLMNLRSLAFNRLLFIVSNLFPEYQPSLRLYGSCATGLALPNSDMDIGITGFESCPSYETTEILQVLLSKLTFLKWVKTYKPIFTASIPVLKIVFIITNFFKIILIGSRPVYRF